MSTTTTATLSLAPATLLHADCPPINPTRRPGLRDAVSGILKGASLGMLQVVIYLPVYLSIPMLVFSHDRLAPYGGYLVQANMLTNAIMHVTFSSMDSIPFVASSLMDVSLPLLASMATTIASHEDTQDWSGDDLAATVMISFSLTCILIGAIFSVLSCFPRRVRAILSCIPIGTTAGLISSIGFFLVKAGLAMGTGLPNVDSLDNLRRAFVDRTLLLLMVVGFACTALLVARRIHHPVALPMTLILPIPLFFAVLYASGHDLDHAAEMGLVNTVDNNATTGMVDFGFQDCLTVTQIAQHNVGFLAIFKTAFLSVLQTILVFMLAMLIQTAALETAMDVDLPMKRETKMLGVANLLVGFIVAGSVSGGRTLSMTFLNGHVMASQEESVTNTELSSSVPNTSEGDSSSVPVGGWLSRSSETSSVELSSSGGRSGGAWRCADEVSRHDSESSHDPGSLHDHDEESDPDENSRTRLSQISAKPRRTSSSRASRTSPPGNSRTSSPRGSVWSQGSLSFPSSSHESNQRTASSQVPAHQNQYARSCGFVAAGISLSFYFFGLPDEVMYIPRFVMGGVIMFIGLDMMISWLVEKRKSMQVSDFLLLWLGFLSIVIFGLNLGIAVSVGGSMVVFIYQYSHLPLIVEQEGFRSNIIRAGKQRQELKGVFAKSVVVFKCEGFAMFGTAKQFVDVVSRSLRSKAQDGDLNLRYVLLDCSRLSGFDASALASFVRLKRIVTANDCELVFGGLKPSFEKILARQGVIDNASPGSMCTGYSSVDLACETIETELYELKVSARDGNRLGGEREAWHETTSFRQLQAIFGVNSDRAVMKYLTLVHLEAGDVLFAKGERCGDGFYILMSGKIVTDIGVKFFKLGNEHPGDDDCSSMSIVGECDFFMGVERSYEAVAYNDCKLYFVDFRKMETYLPTAASRLMKHTICRLSENLQDTKRDGSD